MESKEFIAFRGALDKTQEEIADLLGISVRAVRSYEQGWRTIPTYVERQLLFLVHHSNGYNKRQKPCWIVRKCADDHKLNCPAWQYNSGTLCWFVNGTICEGTAHKNWQEKIKICKSCEMLKHIYD